MTGPLTVKNAVDTWINQAVPARNYNTKARMWLNATTNSQKQGLLFFNRPFPLGANIISAKLRVYAAEAWSGSNTLYAKLLTGKFSINKVNWNNAPGVASAAPSVTLSGTAANALYEIDITGLMQTISGGGQGWYGLRLYTTVTGDRSIHSAQAAVGAYRPAMVIEWSDAPDQPDNLRPSNGRVVNSGYPFLTWDFSDVSGDQNLGAVQVQFGSSTAALDGGSATWDSGTIPSTEPLMDMRNYQSLLADPGFETGVTEWTGTNVALAQTAAQFRSGTKSMQMTSASTSQPLAETAKYPISPGQPAYAYAWFRSAATARQAQIRINWFTATGAANGNTTIAGVTTNTTGWVQAITSGSAPAGTASFSVLVNMQTTVATEVHYVDDVSMSWGNGGYFPAIASGSSVAWRCRNQDGAGLWSDWADSVLIGNLTPITVTNLLVNGASTAIHEGSPTLAWTIGVRTQKAYQVFVNAVNPHFTLIYDSGKITGTATSHTIPFGYLEDASLYYIFTVRVWDTENREAVPGVPVYVEAKTNAITFDYSGAVTNPTGLTFTSDPIVPKATLNFSAATPPDFFQFQRSDDGGTTWYYFDEVVPSEIFVSGTAYAYVDTSAKQYVTHNYKVMRVVAGVQGTGAQTSGAIVRLCPVLMRKDSSDACFFLNPERERQRNSVQGLAERMGGPPVLVTQRIGGQTGHVKGRFVDEAPGSPYTAAKQRKSFLALEEDSGQQLKLLIANETLTVVAYNFNLDVLTDNEGISYVAEFDWIQV